MITRTHSARRPQANPPYAPNRFHLPPPRHRRETPLAAAQTIPGAVTPLDGINTQAELPITSVYGTHLQETPTLSPLHLRMEAWEAFRTQRLLPDPDQLELGHVSALFALLMDGDLGATVFKLIAKPMSKKKVAEV